MENDSSNVDPPNVIVLTDEVYSEHPVVVIDLLELMNSILNINAGQVAK